MFHKIHQLGQGKSHTSASPYNYFGRTHEHHARELRVVPRHAGVVSLRRHHMVMHVAKHGLRSWGDRGMGPEASYKE